MAPMMDVRLGSMADSVLRQGPGTVGLETPQGQHSKANRYTQQQIYSQ